MKITFLGAGSTVFVRNVLGDCMCTPALHGAEIALYDIDAERLDDSLTIIGRLNENLRAGMTVRGYLGVAQRRPALAGADYVINAIQVGGYEPSTVIDFEIPKRYGLRQTIADTLGIGGIFRTLRTLPVMLDIAREMERSCPDALFINYSNPMAMLVAGLCRGSAIHTVGLCHSVQGCAAHLLRELGMLDDVHALQWRVAGINHQGWLLAVTDGGKDLYPAIKRRAAVLTAAARRHGPAKVVAAAKAKHGDAWWKSDPEARVCHDLVRLELMQRFGYYVTESSEHSAEYVPWLIKSRYPGLIEEFNIPLDEYPRRCIGQIAGWKAMRASLVGDVKLSHKRTHEYASWIIEACETNQAFIFGGNVMNTGLIPNLPSKTCVEVMCVADRSGVTPTVAGELPEACAALNRTNINPQILTVDAVLTGRKDCVYQAALLDPHTAAELSIDDTIRLCDDLFKAHGKMIPKLK